TESHTSHTQDIKYHNEEEAEDTPYTPYTPYTPKDVGIEDTAQNGATSQSTHTQPLEQTSISPNQYPVILTSHALLEDFKQHPSVSHAGNLMWRSGEQGYESNDFITKAMFLDRLDMFLSSGDPRQIEIAEAEMRRHM